MTTVILTVAIRVPDHVGTDEENIRDYIEDTDISITSLSSDDGDLFIELRDLEIRN